MVLTRALFSLCIPLLIMAEEGCCQDQYRASLDLLVWKAHEKGAVLTNETSPVFTTTDYTKAPIIHPHFDWDAGFRIGVGYSPSSCCLDLALDWTYYQTTLHQSRKTNGNDLTNVNNQQGMFPIWALSEDIIAGDYVSDAKLKWKILLNMIDFKLLEPCICYKSIDINPYVGIRAASIIQHANVEYSGGIFLLDIIDGGVNLNGTDHIHLKNDFWGIGPRIGFAPRWNFCEGFSIFADTSISGLGGMFDIKQKEEYLGRERFSHRKHEWCFRWIYDFAAGLSWDRQFCNGRYLARFQVSWEYHLFLSQLELRRSSLISSPNKNLQMQGITLSGDIYF
jgi:hypothetical protein